MNEGAAVKKCKPVNSVLIDPCIKIIFNELMDRFRIGIKQKQASADGNIVIGTKDPFLLIPDKITGIGEYEGMIGRGAVQDSFEEAFENYFTIEEKVPVQGSERTLYLFKKRNGK